MNVLLYTTSKMGMIKNSDSESHLHSMTLRLPSRADAIVAWRLHKSLSLTFIFSPMALLAMFFILFQLSAMCRAKSGLEIENYTHTANIV